MLGVWTLGFCVCASAATITLNESVSVNPAPMRIGVNVSASNYYDSGQMFKNLLFTVNPGFEGFIQQEIVGCSSGSATTCVNYNSYDQVPLNYWAGATAYFCCSASLSNSNLGLTATIASNTTAAGQVGPTYTFSSALPQPVATDDYFSVVMQVDSTGSSGMPGWILSGLAAGETRNIPPGSAGVQALSLPSGSCASAYADTTGSHDFVILQTGQTYGFSLKTIAISGSPALTVSISRLGGVGGGVTPSSVTLKPGSSWALQSASFSGNESTGTVYGDLQVQICSAGGTAYVDDADFERTSNLNPANTTVYRDEVVSSLSAINPGSLRLWDYQLGETLADWTNPLFGRHVQSSLENNSYITPSTGRNAGSTAQGLMDFLGLCELIGAKPWITVPLSWPASDYSNLIDFLAGGAGTAYGAKRIAGGHLVPYTSTLGNIYVEFGNEPWNSVFAGIDMPNFSYASTPNGMLSYGHWSNIAMSAMKANPNYSSALHLIVNMQAASTYEYTKHILPSNSFLDAVSIAPYIGTGRLNSVGTFTAEWNPETAFTWGDTNDTGGDSGDGWTYAYVHAAAKPVYVYEDNENQINGTASATILQQHNSSLMAGAVVAQQMLEHLKIIGPNAPQQIWSLAQDQFLNSSSVEIPLYGIMKEAGGEWAGTGNYIQRPLALAAQIANDSIIGPEYLSAVTNADTYTTGASNGLGPESNVPYEFAYCFQNNGNRSCVLVNTDPSNSHTFTLTGSNVPAYVTTRVLSMAGGTIDSCDNESSTPCVTIVTTNGVPLSGGAITVAPGTIEGIDFTSGSSSSTPPVITNVSAIGITGTSATITWTTDQGATSQVEYGATAAYGSLSALSSSLVTSQSVTLTGLTPGTTYYYAALSANSAGQSSTSASFTFSTPATLPVISAVTSGSITPTSATITWTTDQLSSSQVEYGTTAAYGSLSALGSSPVVSHSVTLTGLAPGTTYSFAVLSSTSAGTSTSANFTFTTAATIPAIANVTASSITATSAIITWTTDQASSSQVEYGTTTAWGNLSTYTASPATSHSVILTALTPGTTYDYAVLSSTSAGTATSANFTFSTPGIPVIGAVASGGITTTSAVITWTTDQLSTSQVEYGTTTAYGSLSVYTASPSASHSVTLTGLTPGTTYNYAVLSATFAGTATSANFTFTTPLILPMAPISEVGGAHGNTGLGSAPSSLSIAYASGNGNTIVAACALGNVSSSIGSITDGGSIWIFRAAVNNGSAVRSEIWSTVAGGSVASTSFTISLSAGAPASCALEEYSGVLSLGATATNAATSGTMSVGFTIPEANDYIVAGLGANSYYGYTLTSGAIRQIGGLTSNPGNYVEMDLCDNTAGAAASLGCTSVSSTAPWAAPALVLRPVGAIPIITAVTSNGITATSATITWTTDQLSTSQIEYGTTTAYGSLSALGSLPVILHSVALTGLMPGTTYNYAVLSATSAGTATSANFTFSTPFTGVSISRVGGAHNNTGLNSAPSSLSIAYASHPGNTIVAVCALGNTSSSIGSISDSGSTWIFRAGVSNGSAVRSEIWSTVAGGSVPSTSFTISLSTPAPASCALEEYSGVLGIGATATNAATSGVISVGLTTPEANDYIVAGLGANSYYGYTLTSGAIRQVGGLTSNPGNYVEMDLCDNTAGAATSLSCTSVSSPAPWAAPALVLR
jgi:hypothetical protein